MQKKFTGTYGILSPCLGMIERGENEACKDLYISMVRDMQKKYFFEEQ